MKKLLNLTLILCFGLGILTACNESPKAPKNQGGESPQQVTPNPSEKKS